MTAPPMLFKASDRKLYEGTKRLYAWPLTRGDYNMYRGWVTPHDEDATEPGYLVEYLDGGHPNHPAHEGYISWSPADVFEKTYYPPKEDCDAEVASCPHAEDYRLTENRRIALDFATRYAGNRSEGYVLQAAKEFLAFLNGE